MQRNVPIDMEKALAQHRRQRLNLYPKRKFPWIWMIFGVVVVITAVVGIFYGQTVLDFAGNKLAKNRFDIVVSKVSTSCSVVYNQEVLDPSPLRMKAGDQPKIWYPPANGPLQLVEMAVMGSSHAYAIRYSCPSKDEAFKLDTRLRELASR
jgi:hypothetical protein